MRSRLPAPPPCRIVKRDLTEVFAEIATSKGASRTNLGDEKPRAEDLDENGWPIETTQARTRLAEVAEARHETPEDA